MGVEVIAAIFAGLVALVTSVSAAIMASKNSQKLQDIHVLVDGRLTTALAEIKSLQSVVTQLTQRPR